MGKKMQIEYERRLAIANARELSKWAIEQAAVIEGGLNRTPDSAERIRDTAKVVLEARNLLEKELLALVEKKEGEK